MKANDNVSENNIIQENLISSIEEDQIINKRKIVGLYDPEENGFNLEMWNKTDPKRFLNYQKKLIK